MANKKVFLYVGNYGSSGKYEDFEDPDITRFHADEFVITCGGYDRYLLNNTALNEYLDEMTTLARRVIALTGKTIWLGFPAPPTPTSTITIAEYDHYADQYLNIAQLVKERMDAGNTNYYYTYVQGFYMNDEHVRRKNFTYGTDTDDKYGVNTDVNNLLQHPQIFMYNKVSQGLMSSTHGWKKLLWCPFAGRGANYDTTMIDIAYIANTTDIFDTVLIQPSHYFHGHEDPNIFKNLDLVKNSMNRQEVLRRTADGRTDVRVVAKTSSTIIGCQMEIDERYFNPALEDPKNTQSGYISRYADYISTFSGSNITSSKNRVFSYYCDKKNTYWEKTQDKVNEFFDTL